jgi:hypothetical protein
VSESVHLYHSVRIWKFDDAFVVRGWRRGASHFIAKCKTVNDAIDIAFQVPRKHLPISLVPAREHMAQFGEEIAAMFGVKADD